MRIDREAFTFDDVLLVPARSSVLPRDVELRTAVTRRLFLNIPLLSAAMDTVTESRAAICLAQLGGLGIIHRNFSPERQAAEVRRVKKYESGVISDPITVGPNTTIREVLDLTHAQRISGVPVTDGDQLLGIVTSRDLRFETRLDDPVSQAMTPKEKLVTVREGATREQIQSLLHEHRIEKVLVVDENFGLKGLVTVKDIQKSREYPSACKDDAGRLLAGAAVGTGSDTDERVERLVEAQVDVVVVDTAHGHSLGVLKKVEQIKKRFPELQVIAGNIATAEAARDLVAAGADGVKVGIGPGSICTTRIVAGVGVPQITAVSQVAEALAGSDVPLIADGGIRFSGDIAKAIAAGAHCAMVGGLLAGTDESPGEIELYEGRTYKSYRGMGSLGAMAQGSKDRYFQETTTSTDKLVPEGIEGRVPYKGPMGNVIHQLMGGLRASMGYTGSATVEDMRNGARFVRITNAGMRESHVHDVAVVKEAPNYQRES
ncbi:MAG: IMP dehydrogenase [Gammaproteobacteria bacterium]|nr:IMP dehydrogenase [Gammaproteobacteria bacterium]